MLFLTASKVRYLPWYFLCKFLSNMVRRVAERQTPIIIVATIFYCYCYF